MRTVHAGLRPEFGRLADVFEQPRDAAHAELLENQRAERCPVTAPLLEPTVDRWPSELDNVFERALTCEYASLTRDLRPITWAVTPYRGERSLDVSTGLSYPDKAERARRNPRVALLFSDPTGSESATTPVVLVQGRASVRDADLQGNTDRYVQQSLAKSSGMNGMPWFLIRRMSWYFSRIWIEVSPESMLWWPGGDLGKSAAAVGRRIGDGGSVRPGTRRKAPTRPGATSHRLAALRGPGRASRRTGTHDGRGRPAAAPAHQTGAAYRERIPGRPAGGRGGDRRTWVPDVSPGRPRAGVAGERRPGRLGQG